MDDYIHSKLRRYHEKISFFTLLFSILNHCINGVVFEYNSEMHIGGGEMQFISLSIVSPSARNPGLISWNLQFKTDAEGNDVRLENVAFAIVALDPQLLNHPSIFKGPVYNHKQDFCCREDMQSDGFCSIAHSLLFDERIEVVTNSVIEFPATSVSPSSGSKNLTSEKLYMFAFATCAQTKGASFTGTINLKGPSGYLSARDYPFIPFYSYMSLSYFSVGVIWLVLNIMYREEVMHVQNCISAVLCLCLIEMLAWFVYYDAYNNNGTQPIGAFVCAILASGVRRTVSRMLIVAVSKGFGVSKPSLGSSRNHVFLAGGIYFIFESIFLLYIHLGHNNNALNVRILLLLYLPVSCADAGFYTWILSSLSDTIKDLETRFQTHKLKAMFKLSYVLMSSLVLACIFGFVRIYILRRGLQYTYWRFTFILMSGFSQQLYFCLLVSIAFLWRPSPHSHNIAYAEQINSEEDAFRERFSLELDDVDLPNEKFALNDDDQLEMSYGLNTSMASRTSPSETLHS